MVFPSRKFQLSKERQIFNLSVIKWFGGMVKLGAQETVVNSIWKGGGGKTSWRGSLNSSWKKRISPVQLCGHLRTERAVSAVPWNLRHIGKLGKLYCCGCSLWCEKQRKQWHVMCCGPWLGIWTLRQWKDCKGFESDFHFEMVTVKWSDEGWCGGEGETHAQNSS